MTDGEPVVFREFLTRMLGTQGVRSRTSRCRRAWRGSRPPRPSGSGALLKRPGSPPLTRFAVWVSSQECTIDISRAERELGYRPVTSREEGLAELSSGRPGSRRRG